MKIYTFEELKAFCGRADTKEKRKTAFEFIDSRPYLAEAEKEELFELLDNEEDWPYDENPFLPDYLDRGSRDYGPSNPWDAPGMRVSDFITGVRMF